MVKNTKQIALIQHRRGKLSELPTQLNEGEFGLALDTNELFIGNSSNPALAERIESNTFPYGNIQILTEFTDNLQKIIYRYKSNTDIKAHLPIVVKGNRARPSVSGDTSIIINGTEVVFNSSSTVELNGIIQKINDTLGPTIKAFTDDNSHISFVTTENSLTLEDGIKLNTDSEGNVAKLGFGEKSFTEISSLPPERTLQERLDDFVTIKSFGAYGDGTTTDDGNVLYNAILALNKAGVDAKYYRTLFLPSGTYLTSRSIPLPYGTHLKGEGIKRTIIKSKNFSNTLFVSMDDNMNISTANSYGINANPGKYITIEDMTIDVSDTSSSNIVSLVGCENVVFKNVEFLGSQGTNLIVIDDSFNTQNTKHICFDSCIFNTGNIGIKAQGNTEHLVVKNCLFKNIKNSSIYLNPYDDKMIVNSIIEGNYFKDCGENKSIIYLGENTSYISTVNNRFDEENSTYTAAHAYESLSTMNYADILDPRTDKRKLLQFNFTQPEWAYVDYLMNPNGEYLLKSEYTIQTIDGVDVIKPLTNGFVLKQGDETNNNVATLKTTSETGDLSITSGVYGKVILGNNDNNLPYIDWIKENLYNEGDKVQIKLNDNYLLYECIKQITEIDIAEDRDITPSEYSEYWRYLGTYTPSIQINKTIDLNKNNIMDNTGNITFKTSKNNYLTVDDSSRTTDYTYAERIAKDKNAIPNIDYINTYAQTTIRKKFNYEKIQNYGKNKQEIVYFDNNIYGAFVNMNFINVNVRRPFYPLLSNLNDALEWRSGLRYYVGDVIKAVVENVQEPDNYTMKIDMGNFWQTLDHEHIPVVDEQYIDGDGKPVASYPPEDPTADKIYAITFDNTERNLFFKTNNRWYVVGSDEWKDLYPSYAEVKLASGNYRRNSVIKLRANWKEYLITLSSDPSLENFKADIESALDEDSGISIIVEGAYLKISQTGFNKGRLLLSNYRYDALDQIGFEIDADNNVTLNTVKFLKSFDETTFNASDYIDNTIWIKSDGITEYFTCLYDNIASETFNQDLGEDGSLSKWIRVDTDDIKGNPLKELKYVGILAQADDTATDEIDELKENEQRLLFLKDVIDVTKRDIKSIYEDEFRIVEKDDPSTLKQYNRGDRCYYAGRYWECLDNNTPGDDGAYVLHDPNLWKAVPEEGFNYHFDFEKELYLIDENDNIVTADNVTLNYNFANYHFYLMFYDEDGNRLIPYATDYDLTGYTYKGTVPSMDYLPNPEEEGVVLDINDYYTIENTREKYYYNGIGWEPIEPETHLGINPSGHILITINYLRTQEDE